MDSYVKSMKLSIDAAFSDASKKSMHDFVEGLKETKINLISDNDVKEFSNKLDRAFSDSQIVKSGLLPDEKLQELKNIYLDKQKNELEIKGLQQLIKEFETLGYTGEEVKDVEDRLAELLGKQVDEAKKSANDVGAFGGGFKNAAKEWAADKLDMSKQGEKAFNKMKDTISKWATKSLEAIKSFVQDALKEMSNMASFSANTTKYNATSSEMLMNWGLSGADAYAVQSALQSTGIGSIDTLLTDPTISKELMDAFKKDVDLARKQYEEDIEIAEEYQKFQREFSVFKRELQKEVIDFFMNNKDTIKSFLEITMQSMKTIVKIVAAIGEFLTGEGSYKTTSDSERQQITSDILGISTNGGSTKSITMNMNNTYNGVNYQDKQSLIDSDNLRYRQGIAAWNGI